MVQQLFHVIKYNVKHLSRSFKSDITASFNLPSRSSFFGDNRYGKEGLFGCIQLTKECGFDLLKESARIHTENYVTEALQKTRKRKIVRIFDDLSNSLCKIADMCEFLRQTHPDGAIRRKAEDVCINVGGIVESLNTNVSLFKVVDEVAVSQRDVEVLDSIDKRVAVLFLHDFQLSGVHLSEQIRADFVAEHEKILRNGSSFLQSAYAPVSVPRKDIPKRLLDCFSVNGDAVCVSGLYADHHLEEVREAAYKLYMYKDAGREELLAQLLRSRRLLANIAGFKSFSDRAQQGTIMADAEIVRNFLKKLSGELKSSADRDIQSLQSLKGSAIKPWDLTYFTAQARHALMPNVQLHEFLSLGNCMEGLAFLSNALYGVKVKVVNSDPGETWHEQVHKLEISEENGDLLGYIYCDFFERNHKIFQDCHFTIQGGRMAEDGHYQVPKVVLVLNMAAPSGEVPPLLTLGHLENLFHEWGHAMHSMLGRTRYQHVTGTRCSTDFAEIPSILMEYFAKDPRVVCQFARHWQTNESLSPDVFSLISRARHKLASWELRQQVLYSLVDLELHSQVTDDFNIHDVVKDIQDEHGTLTLNDNTAWYLRFTHFVGYGAKYYAYLVARATASTIWKKNFMQDPLDRSAGEFYRQRMLSSGGERPPREQINELLGKELNSDEMVSTLLQDCKMPES